VGSEMCIRDRERIIVNGNLITKILFKGEFLIIRRTYHIMFKQ